MATNRSYQKNRAYVEDFRDPQFPFEGEEVAKTLWFSFEGAF